jgi:hypothetical protein
LFFVSSICISLIYLVCLALNIHAKCQRIDVANAILSMEATAKQESADAGKIANSAQTACVEQAIAKTG